MEKQITFGGLLFCLYTFDTSKKKGANIQSAQSMMNEVKNKQKQITKESTSYLIQTALR